MSSDGAAYLQDEGDSVGRKNGGSSMQDELKWLEDGIVYEIYPQSFLDTNEDGIGDLNGIIKKLDYVKNLGCNIIWINACSESAFRDGGYDVTDYYNVAHRYGTNETMKLLFEKAHEKGIRVLLDFVPGHTSDEHPWFLEFAESTEDGFDNRFIWIPECYDVTATEEHVVALEGRRKGHYVANFYDFQPALNYGYANPDPSKPWQLEVESETVQRLVKEMMDVMRFWLDMGADGLRVDMAASLVKGDVEGKKTSTIWHKVRAMMDCDYPHAVLLSEWSDPKVSINAGFHMDFMIHVNTNAYNSLFRNEHGRNVNPGQPGAHSFFDCEGKGNIREFLDIFMENYRKVNGKGYICIPSGNHDIPRLCFGRNVRELKLCFTFLLTMPGIPVIYYGDELGMVHQTGLPDKEGGKLGEEEFTNRSGARTPMQWTSGKNAGFSAAEGEKLYLPISPDYQKVNVEMEEEDDNSLLNYVKKLTALRHRMTALKGMDGFEPVYAETGKYPFVYQRSSESEKIWIILNPAKRSEQVILPGEGKMSWIVCEGISEEASEHTICFKCDAVSYGIVKFQ